MTSRKWSFSQNKSKSVAQKPFWDNRVTRAIASRTLSLRRHKSIRDGAYRPRRILTARRRIPLRIPITTFTIPEESQSEGRIVEICEPRNLEVVSKEESYEKIWPALSNIEQNMVIPSNLIPKNMRVMKINHFLNFRRDFIFSINLAEKMMPLLAILDGITAIKVDRNEPKIFGNFIDFTESLSKGCISNEDMKPLLSSLESISSTKIEESSSKFFGDFQEYIESLIKESKTCDDVKELRKDLESLSQIVVGESDSIKLGEFFAGIAEIEDEISSRTYMVPLLASMENISRIHFKESNTKMIGEFWNGIEENTERKNSVTLLPLFDSIEQLSNISKAASDSKINNILEQLIPNNNNAVSENNIAELKPILSAIESITSAQVKASITSMMGEFFKYVNDLNDKQNKPQELDLKLASSSLENVVSRMQHSLTNVSSMEVHYNTCSGNTDPRSILTPLAPNRPRFQCLSTTSLCSCSSNVYNAVPPPPPQNSPVDVNFYTMEANAVLQHISELENQINAMSNLQNRLKLYYDFLKQHQSSA
uniref:WSN domain-containing protein n=1 Tax=Parastrongyloides trichosuri TaxID=131310 RepID=A0A0N4ZAK5_PARTI